MNDIQTNESEMESLRHEKGKDVRNRRKCAPKNPLGIFLDTVENSVKKFRDNNKKMVNLITLISLWIISIAYVVVACVIDFERARVLLYLAVITNLCIFYHILKKGAGSTISRNVLVPLKEYLVSRCSQNVLNLFAVVAFVVFVLLWLICDTAKPPSRFISLVGLFAFVLIGYVFSTHRNDINWRPVIWGFALQFVFGLIVLRTNAGYQVFKWMGDVVATLLAFSSAGAEFVFPGLNQFAFTVLPIIPYFSALTYLLWYLGVVQILIKKVGWLLQCTLGTSPAESFNAAANIFIGMTTAPLHIRPFLQGMTESELHAVMTGGFATIAGSVLAIYIHFGVSASHLISASIMSAPAALAMSKLMCPEVEEPEVSYILSFSHLNFEVKRRTEKLSPNRTSIVK